MTLKERFKKPTPKRAKLIGETFQDIGMIVAGASAVFGNSYIPFIALAIGKIGKIISRLSVLENEK